MFFGGQKVKSLLQASFHRVFDLLTPIIQIKLRKEDTRLYLLLFIITCMNR